MDSAMSITQSRVARALPTLSDWWRSPFGITERVEPQPHQSEPMSESNRRALELSLQPIETRQIARSHTASDFVQ